MISEVTNNVWTYFKEKAASPLYRTLIVTWCLWNWRILYLTFFIDEKTIAPLTKLNFISTHYNNGWVNYGYPLISAVLAIFIFPYAENVAYFFSLNRKKERMLAKVKSEDETPIPRKDAAILQKKLRDGAINHQVVLDNKDAVIETLTSDLKTERQIVVKIKKNNTDSMKVLQDEMAKRVIALEELKTSHKNEKLSLEMKIRDFNNSDRSTTKNLPQEISKQLDTIINSVSEPTLIDYISRTNNGVLASGNGLVVQVRDVLVKLNMYHRNNRGEYIITPIGCLVALKLFNDNTLTPAVYKIAINGF